MNKFTLTKLTNTINKFTELRREYEKKFGKENTSDITTQEAALVNELSAYGFDWCECFDFLEGEYQKAQKAEKLDQIKKIL